MDPCGEHGACNVLVYGFRVVRLRLLAEGGSIERLLQLSRTA